MFLQLIVGIIILEQPREVDGARVDRGISEVGLANLLNMVVCNGQIKVLFELKLTTILGYV